MGIGGSFLLSDFATLAGYAFGIPFARRNPQVLYSILQINAAGYAHLDVTPTNIMVSTTTVDLMLTRVGATLVDFGSAQALEVI